MKDQNDLQLGFFADSPTTVKPSAQSRKEPKTPARLRMMPLDRLQPDPDRPRQTVDVESIGKLAATMASQGLWQPVLVCPSPDGKETFRILKGHRRWEAARLAGLRQLPVVVTNPDNPMEVSLTLHLHCETLCAIDEAEALARCADANSGTDRDLAARLGIHQSRISVARRIAKLDSTTKAAARARRLSAAVLAELARDGLSDADRTRLLALAPEQLTREAVRAALGAHPEERPKRPKPSSAPRPRAYRYVRKAIDALIEDPSFSEPIVLSMTVGELLEVTSVSEP